MAYEETLKVEMTLFWTAELYVLFLARDCSDKGRRNGRFKSMCHTTIYRFHLCIKSKCVYWFPAVDCLGEVNHGKSKIPCQMAAVYSCGTLKK